ncbi:hypothetical protein BsWGS_23717 [Bradybaena similaris]
MNRNRLGGRDRGGRGFGGGDGLLGEGPGMGGGLFEPMVNPQVNQLIMAQQLLQQQAALGGFGGGGGDYGMGGFGGMGSLGNMHYLQQQGIGFGGTGGSRIDRKRDKKEKDKEKDGNLFCHVCNVSVYDEDSFRRHLNGNKHAQRMNSLLTVHQLKSNQLKSRLQAEEHLRKIEGKSGADPDFFCKICNNSLTIPWERHRFSNIHKQRQLQVKRGCGWCNVHDFNNFTEVLQHRETDQHKKNAELYGKKQDGSTSRSGSREREENEDLTIPEYNSENPVGVNYIIPVTGFFCKLCHKFYNNEKSAKGAHCQSEAHYERLKQTLEAKQEAREKRLAEVAAVAAEKKVKEEKDHDMDEEKAAKNGGHEDNEDYDDDLPLEDEDNEGGLVEDGITDLVKDTTAESFLNETSADSSFVYLSGDMVQEQQERALLADSSDLQSQDQDYSYTESYTTCQSGTEDTSMNVSGEEDDGVNASDDDSAPAPGKSSAKVKGGASAKRDRGKGKVKK